MKAYPESKETPKMEAKSHPSSFLKKAVAEKSRIGRKSAPRGKEKAR